MGGWWGGGGGEVEGRSCRRAAAAAAVEERWVGRGGCGWARAGGQPGSLRRGGARSTLPLCPRAAPHLDIDAAGKAVLVGQRLVAAQHQGVHGVAARLAQHLRGAVLRHLCVTEGTAGDSGSRLGGHVSASRPANTFEPTTLRLLLLLLPLLLLLLLLLLPLLLLLLPPPPPPPLLLLLLPPLLPLPPVQPSSSPARPTCRSVADRSSRNEAPLKSTNWPGVICSH